MGRMEETVSNTAGALQAMAQQLAEESDAVFPLLQALPLSQSSLVLDALTGAGVSYVGPTGEAARGAGHKLRANQRIAELGFPAMPMMALERSDVASEETFEVCLHRMPIYDE